MFLTPVQSIRSVLLPRPIVGAQRARVKLISEARFGAFEFGFHSPLNGSSGVVVTDLTSGTAVAFGPSFEAAIDMLQRRLENETVTTFISRCQLAVEHNKQNTEVLIGYTS